MNIASKYKEEIMFTELVDIRESGVWGLPHNFSASLSNFIFLFNFLFAPVF